MVHLRVGSARPRHQPSQRLPLTIVILSEARRSVATKHESKDPLPSASSRASQGILTAQADRRSTSALEERGRGHQPVPHALVNIVILSEARRSVATKRESKDPLPSASSRPCQGILTAPADRRSTSASEARGRGINQSRTPYSTLSS